MICRACASILCFVLTLVWMVPANQFEDQGFESEDQLLVLTKLTEQMTLSQLSLPGLRCREEVLLTEFDKKGQVVGTSEYLYDYEVRRLPDKRVNGQLIFEESRKPAGAVPSSPEQQDFPLFEKPFTGSLIQMFSYENRLAHEFLKVREEKLEGRDCALFAFRTVPQLSGGRLSIRGKEVPLRQQGEVWIDVKSNELVRVTARQLKVPRGVKAYRYQVDFDSPAVFGEKVILPKRIVLEMELKGKAYRVEFSYKAVRPL